jgi:hypothetical protein
MTAANPVILPTAEGRLETVRVITETLRIVTDKRLELYNLTEKVADIVKRHDIKEGMVLLSSLHTTVAALRERVAVRAPPRHQGDAQQGGQPKDEWRHNDPCIRTATARTRTRTCRPRSSGTRSPFP